jgi:succinate dehydrogenase/fumarate reductase-like Fe-S protein
MSDKVVLQLKPIDEVVATLQELVIETKSIKSDIRHIKEYIRKNEVRETLKRDREEKVEEEYVKPSKSWFW